MSGSRRIRPTATRWRIAVTPVGAVDESLLHSLISYLERAFDASVTIAKTIPLPEDAYNSARRQYQSTVLLDALAEQKQPTWERQLGVADADLYTPDLNFVFGEADATRGIAVFSIARLHVEDRDRFVRRAATEAIHEVAHTYGLGHCANPQCVMWFSNTLEETDRKGTGFCHVHAETLRRAIGRVRSRP